MKILCNKCYANELTIHDYSGKLYADPCECYADALAEHELELEDVYNNGVGDGREDGQATGYQKGLREGKEEGYDTGFEDGHSDGWNEGHACGYEKGISDGEERE